MFHILDEHLRETAFRQFETHLLCLSHRPPSTLKEKALGLYLQIELLEALNTMF